MTPDVGPLRGALNEVERQVMEALLRGDHPTLSTLREQFATAEVGGRESSGVGFFTRLSVSLEAPRLPPSQARVLLTDVFAMVEGLRHEVGFHLYVTDGLLDTLEGYTFGDPWPENPKLVRVFYMRPESGGHGGLVETSERDLEWALHGTS